MDGEVGGEAERGWGSREESCLFVVLAHEGWALGFPAPLKLWDATQPSKV